MPFVQTGSHKLHYALQGQGEPLVLLHGVGGSVNAMRDEISSFASQYTAIGIDFRGHGRSDRCGSYRIEDLVGDVRTVLQALDVGDCVMVGTSLGSYVAQNFAIEYRDNVSKLVLVASRSHAERSALRSFTEARRLEIAATTEDERRRIVRRLLMAPCSETEIAATIDAMERAQGASLSAADRDLAEEAVTKFDFRPALPKISARTLVVSGAHDPLNPPELGREICRLIPNSSFAWFDRSGHFPRWEEPTRYFNVVEEFLSDDGEKRDEYT